jgi:transposase
MSASHDLNKPPWSTRRSAVASMLAAGIPMPEIARRLQLSPATASRYESLFAVGGAKAILRLNDVGRRSVLDVRALSWLTSAIKHSPRLHGFETDVWNREQLRIFVEREFGITYSPSHLNRIVRDLGLSHRLAIAPGRRGAERDRPPGARGCPATATGKAGVDGDDA